MKELEVRTPWSKIGTQLAPSTDTVQEVLQQAHLDWGVVQKKVYSDFGVVPDKLANYRGDTQQFLGFASERYKVVQNREAFSFIDDLNDFTFDKAGSTADSRKVWIVGKYDRQLEISPVDRTDTMDFYMTFLHGHDGKSGIRMFLCPIRMFCTNQLNLMTETSTFKHSIKHTGTVDEKLKMLSRTINSADAYITELGGVITEQLAIKMTDQQVQDNIVQLFEVKKDDAKRTITRKENTQELIMDIYRNTDNLQNYRGTAFGFINAVSDYATHRQPDRRTDTFYEKEFVSLLEGEGIIEQARRLVAA